ncbi:MAG: hypothetical protein ACO3XL_10125, partial [Gemmobacter sp.]
ETRMRSLSLLAVGVLASSAHAGLAGNSQNYNDASLDLFDNGLDNLDISSVDVSDDGVNLSITVTTRGFQNWTKYMMYFDTVAGGTTSNAWSRPVDLSGASIEYYLGSWVDAPSNNTQFVSWTGSAWNWGSEMYRRTGRMMPADGLKQIEGFDAIFFGAGGAPGVTRRPDAPLARGPRAPRPRPNARTRSGGSPPR